MLVFAMRLNELNKTLKDFPKLDIYEKHYGLSNKDLGLYALHEHTIAGAAWVRLLKAKDGANAYVDANTPVLNIAVKPELRGKGVGSAMLEQLLLEAGEIFEQISVSVVKSSKAMKFYEKFGFKKLEASAAISPVDSSEVITMTKQLLKKAVIRPTDGYNPKKWMD